MGSASRVGSEAGGRQPWALQTPRHSSTRTGLRGPGVHSRRSKTGEAGGASEAQTAREGGLGSALAALLILIPLTARFLPVSFPFQKVLLSPVLFFLCVIV